ncbi:unnamed protein product [Amoebophrya sp. A25]|nr:unnamed protein product [Amoebophrya sp. A25]|eukprot:GSA25T00021977001.1
METAANDNENNNNNNNNQDTVKAFDDLSLLNCTWLCDEAAGILSEIRGRVMTKTKVPLNIGLQSSLEDADKDADAEKTSEELEAEDEKIKDMQDELKRAGDMYSKSKVSLATIFNKYRKNNPNAGIDDDFPALDDDSDASEGAGSDLDNVDFVYDSEEDEDGGGQD